MLFIILSANYHAQTGNFVITSELCLPCFDWFNQFYYENETVYVVADG